MAQQTDLSTLMNVLDEENGGNNIKPSPRVSITFKAQSDVTDHYGTIPPDLLIKARQLNRGDSKTNIARPNSPPPVKEQKAETSTSPPTTTTTTTSMTSTNGNDSAKKELALGHYIKIPQNSIKSARKFDETPRNDSYQAIPKHLAEKTRSLPEVESSNKKEETSVTISKSDNAAIRSTTKIELLPNLEGYLEKVGDSGVVKLWKKRFCCLKEDKLIYYKDRADKEYGNVIGYIPLHDASSVHPTPDRVGGFQVNTPLRTWYLRITEESNGDMQKWVDACTIHSNFKEQPQFPRHRDGDTKIRSLTRSEMMMKDGELEKLHGKSWKMRYLVVKDGILYKYKSRDDYNPPKKIHLYKCTLEEDKECEKEYWSFKITSRKRTLALRTKNEFEMHDWLNSIQKHKLLIEQIIDSTK